MHLFDLPYDILIQLRKYLCPTTSPDQYLRPNFGMFRTKQSDNTEEIWRNFTNISRTLSELKRKTIILVLSPTHAVRYLREDSFRSEVEKLIEDKSKQLHFRIKSINVANEEYFHWNNSQGITCKSISNQFDGSVFTHIRVLNLTKTAVSFVCNLVNLQYLTVRDCGKLKTISNLPSLQQLWVESCKALTVISNVPSLQKVFINSYDSLQTLSIPPLQHLEIVNHSQALFLPELITSTRYHLGINFGDEQIDAVTLSKFDHFQSLCISHAYLECELSSAVFPSVRALVLLHSSYPKLNNLMLLEDLCLFNCTIPHIAFQSLPVLRNLKLSRCQYLTQINLSSSEHCTVILKRVEITSCRELRKIIIQRKIRSFSIHCGSRRPEIVIAKSAEVQSLKVNDVPLLVVGKETITIK